MTDHATANYLRRLLRHPWTEWEPTDAEPARAVLRFESHCARTHRATVSRTRVNISGYLATNNK
jgi:hypothetical protein